MSACKISIIMPAYNAEKTISRAVASCVNQTLQDIELIIVDDCSTDRTPDLLREFHNSYPDKVKTVFQKENMRQGAARNAGFRQAEGEYILFVDSDDWIELDACERFYSCARLHPTAEEIVADYDLVYDSGEQRQINVFHSVPESLGIQTPKTSAVLLRQAGYFWCKMYKKEFLARVFPNGALFPEKMQYEDSAFNTLATLLAREIVKLDYCFYHYYQNSNSTVRNVAVQLDKIKVAKYLLASPFSNGELKDHILMKCTVLCGAALLYGVLPLYKTQRDLCERSLNEIAEITPLLMRGKYYSEVSADMRKNLERNFKSHRLYLWKLRYF